MRRTINHLRGHICLVAILLEMPCALANSAAVTPRVRTVTICQNPVGLAVDWSRGRAFVSCQGKVDTANGAIVSRGEVDMVDVRTGAVLKKTAVGWAPSAIAIDEQRQHVFVANYADRSVSMLDARSGRLLSTTRVDMGPNNMAVDGSADRVLIANRGTLTSNGNSIGAGSIVILDARTGRQLHTVTVAGGMTSLLLDQRRHHVLLYDNSNPSQDSIAVLDSTNGRLLRSITLGADAQPLAVDERSGHALAVRQVAALVSLVIFDTATARTMASVPINQYPQHTAMGQNSGRALVVTSGYPILAMALDLRTGHLLRQLTVSPTLNTQGVAIDSSTGDGVIAAANASPGATQTTLFVFDFMRGIVRQTVLPGGNGDIVAASVYQGHAVVIVSATPSGVGRAVLADLPP